jgi:hypothetical protein
MLGNWRKHKEYLNFLRVKFERYFISDPAPLLEYRDIFEKLWHLDLDGFEDVFKSFYKTTGRKAQSQPEILRAFILMEHLDFHISKLSEKLKHNFVLRTICGFSRNDVPATASFYDFIKRITGPDKKPRARKFKRKPNKKIGKGNKLLPKHPKIVARMKERIVAGRRFHDKTAVAINKILSLCVRNSIRLGIINDEIDVSGDGTCVETGASHYGRKSCKCKENGIYDCSCPRKFSDPSASWGWDSHNDCYFYGYSAYIISAYGETNKVDLPLFLRVVDAKRHDSVSAIVALSEFRDLYNDISIRTFISDSASDNYATYELLEYWDICAVIALGKSNDGNTKHPVPIAHDPKGTPICPSGHSMIDNGYCKGRYRIKWRCPRVLNKADATQICASCSPSRYGRVVYTKPKWDPRLFCRIPRGTKQWKELMKQRTAAERVNKRILLDYGVENSKSRGKKRISFLILIAAINIHLDAQLKALRKNGRLSMPCIAA